jgi:hypothetical protein
MKSRIHYITIATIPHIILDIIKRRVEAQGETIKVLGENENRLIGWQSTGNFGAKLIHVYSFLYQGHLNDDDIVLFTDAYDVIYCGDLVQTVARFEEMNIPILFGAETTCNPDPEMSKKYPKSTDDVEFPYLNSGLFIGRVWALKQCMKNTDFSDSDDDQRFWTKQFLKNPDLIHLDYKNRLFLNTFGVDLELITWNGVYAHYRDRNPLFVHVNGPEKNDLRKFLSPGP